MSPPHFFLYLAPLIPRLLEYRVGVIPHFKTSCCTCRIGFGISGGDAGDASQTCHSTVKCLL